jgi:hypothetical protein
MAFYFFLAKRCKHRSARLMLNASVTACQRMEDDWLKADRAGYFAGLGIRSCWLPLPELLTIFIAGIFSSMPMREEARGGREI